MGVPYDKDCSILGFVFGVPSILGGLGLRVCRGSGFRF